MTTIRLHRLWWHRLTLALIVAVQLLAVDSRDTQAQTVTPAAIPESSAAVQVSPYLAAELASGTDAVSMLVLLKDQPDLAMLDAAFSASGEGSHLDSTARRTALYQQLTAHALQSQADLRAWLAAQGIPYRAHYIINMISVSGDAALVEALRQRPDVARLDANPVVEMIDAKGAPDVPNAINRASVNRWARWLDVPNASASPNTPYGVAATRAPEVWAMGYTGQGITVASQDTGVQWDHPALQPHYRGAQGETVDHDYNWLDAIPETGVFDRCAGLDSPCDDNGHGTHTVGTMLGTTGVITYGVAPDAQWMGCRNMRGGVGTPETYTTCFEFFLAPYPPGGDSFTDGRPELAPHIINNSWGCPEREGCNKDSLRQVVETVRAAGLMVVASAGNNGGAGCSSVIDPIAIYDATFSVGAHDAAGFLAGFSSRGPVSADGSGRLKPDITAPGVGVLSTYPFGSATELSGTSMASPHVAGAAALLWSASPWLVGNVDLTEQVLLKSAKPVNSTECGSGEEISPNNVFGYGMLDAAAAVEMALQPWHVTVTVTNGVGAPVVGATVEWVDARTSYTYTTTSDTSGAATISPMLAGTYRLLVRDEAGVVQIDHVALSADESGAQSFEILVLYDATQVPYPSRHYLPGIRLN